MPTLKAFGDEGSRAPPTWKAGVGSKAYPPPTLKSWGQVQASGPTHLNAGWKCSPCPCSLQTHLQPCPACPGPYREVRVSSPAHLKPHSFESWWEMQGLSFCPPMSWLGVLTLWSHSGANWIEGLIAWELLGVQGPRIRPS